MCEMRRVLESEEDFCIFSTAAVYPQSYHERKAPSSRRSLNRSRAEIDVLVGLRTAIVLGLD